MSTSKNIQIVGFPDVWGGRSKAIPVDHYGLASYTTGGEVFPAQSVYGGPNSLGLSSVYWCNGGVTEDGLYLVVPVFGGKGMVNGTIKLKWYSIAASTGGTFAGTPAVLTGTVAAPTITTSSGGVATPIGVAAGALSETVGATGITGVQAPALTMNSYTPAGTISGGSGGGYVEVSAATDLSASYLRILVIGG